MLIKFATTTIDVDARSVSRDQRHVHLTPKAFDVLVLLALARPRVVPKAEILDRVWPGTFVTDASLARTVHEIRDAVADTDGAIIRTVHGHGYAFTAEAVDEYPPLQPAPPAAAPLGPRRASLHLGLQAVPLRDGDLVIGRDPAAAIPLPFAPDVVAARAADGHSPSRDDRGSRIEEWHLRARAAAHRSDCAQ